MHSGRKGQFELSMTIIEVVIIILGLVTLFTVIRMWWQPYRQTSFANAELLRLTIDDVCAGSIGSSKTIDNFNFPQPEPLTLGGIGTTVVPRLMIRAKGDPYYLLYFENFPPGEAVTWEVYSGAKPRALAWLGNTGEDPTKVRQNLQSYLLQYGVSGDIVFSNLILGSDAFPGSGKWDGNFFKFNSSLTPNQRALMKYPACGAGSLCLKTEDGVYRLDMPNCRGVKLMQVLKGKPSYIKEAKDFFSGLGKNLVAAVAVGGTGVLTGGFSAVPGFAFTLVAGSIVNLGKQAYDILEGYSDAREVSDFYLASPCKAKLIIKKATCFCRDYAPVIPDLAWYRTTYTGRYHLMDVVDGKTTFLKDKATCLQHFSESKFPSDSDPVSSSELCVTVEIDSSTADGFCVGDSSFVPLGAGWLKLQGYNAFALFDMNELKRISVSSWVPATIFWGWPNMY